MITYIPAPDIKLDLVDIARKLGMKHVFLDNVICMRSKGSTSRNCLARIWGLDRIWQLALQTNAHYIVEVISERYDHLPQSEKEKVLIHELMHIPKKFRGGLRNHQGEFGRTIGTKLLEKLQKTLHEQPLDEPLYIQDSKSVRGKELWTKPPIWPKPVGRLAEPNGLPVERSEPKGLLEKLQKAFQLP